MSEATESAIMTVLITAPDMETAERIGTTVVEERLAACANVVPGVTSIFRWQGAVEREQEVLVVLKTTSDGVDRLRERVVGLHPYDVPEVIALPVGAGHEPYLEWVRTEVGAAP